MTIQITPHWTRLAVASLLTVAGVTTACAEPVTIGISLDFTTLDPHESSDNLSFSAQRMIMPGLFGFDETMKVIPVLAEGYTVSGDAKEFTIKLRKGVLFHDGTTFNAQAVKATFDRVSNPENKHKRYTLFANIASTEVVDDNTVRIKLKEPFSSMINVLAHPSAAIMSPAAIAKYGKDFGSNPVGAGPFKFVEWRRSNQLTLTRNETYYKPGLPKIDGVVLKPTPENNTRVASLLSGGAHFIYPMAPEQMESIKGREGVEAVARSSSLVRYLALNTQKKPFDDVRVRQAVNFAINKKAFAKIVFSGYAQPLQSVMTKSVEFFEDQGEWPYDPAKAKALLAEAGYPNGFETELWGANTSTTIRAMEFAQQQLGQVGIKVKAIPMETSQRVDKTQNVSPATSEMRMHLSSWSPSTGEGDWALRPLLATASQPPKANNIGFYSNARVDALLQEGLAVSEQGKRQKIYGEIQRIVWPEAPWGYLGAEDNLWAQSKRLKGVYILPDNTLVVSDEATLN